MRNCLRKLLPNWVLWIELREVLNKIMMEKKQQFTWGEVRVLEQMSAVEFP